jgi:hypothetical protein
VHPLAADRFKAKRIINLGFPERPAAVWHAQIGERNSRFGETLELVQLV